MSKTVGYFVPKYLDFCKSLFFQISSFLKSILKFYWDIFAFYNLGIVITACLPIHKNQNTYEGVACVDMLMRDLISDLTAFPNLDVGYTLMLDSAGT